MTGQIAALLVVLVVAALVVRPRWWASALAVPLVVAVALVGRPGPSPSPPAPIGPTTTLDYVSSAACVSCHPGEHASFGRTFHRTMTQVATPSAVRAPFGARLEQRGSEVWSGAQKVVLVTGSHREQAFWTAGEDGDLKLLPFVWMVRAQTWLARRDAFVLPPDAPMPEVHWASSCIACHAVAGEPRHLGRAWETRAAELGIACEACHGPGRAHVERHRDPVVRYMQYTSKTPDPTIVHPRRLSPERSAAVCGQCHAYTYPRNETEWWEHGQARTFRAGDLLEPSRDLVTPTALHVDAPVESLFWPDGSVRVGGREYNGLVESPCWVRGSGARKITCLSCHAMHAGDPAGQIAPDRRGDLGCTSCHSVSPDHSRHAAVACVDCHMPRTSYALLEAVRSHRISSPRIDAAAPPNACTLCHLDETPAWTARWLVAWYGKGDAGLADLSPLRQRTPAGQWDALAGDAGMRAILADAFATSPFGATVRTAVLDELRHDPYAAVRFIAERAARTTPRVTGLPFDPAILAARDRRAVTIAE